MRNRYATDLRYCGFFYFCKSKYSTITILHNFLDKKCKIFVKMCEFVLISEFASSIWAIMNLEKLKFIVSSDFKVF